MTAIIRNTLLAFVAASALAGSAMAGQQAANTECENSPTNKLWAGRCCGIADSNCLGGEGHGHEGRGGRQR
ncbi:hypothetical protein EN817_28385 [Mesorhizobium sp. M3A.F.Ca.ET.174.01.1.1]|nr:hypothetical protein EJ074_05090 [Mesorhizobium sp. M3A.F.Ca.ET.080.04.2.1]PBB85450.1 hypothetical protein CK216_17470 [Mesorhizobium sp. WSM3876]RWB71830.1 MAG: hypothetical protein EOQ49_14300 [Mesorhizobium sp.]TGS62141.1 hypothetical protein EN844_26875 [Mesorhizobium sp. M3A.F.Ca.ET.201.01.1.1]TGS82340.1 hypothetical protein EN818_27835 [Mesorhizobium sp. M3A.F.Ca.ET.175.01.1.1]TGT22156.1 hypothetical protein EN817_28385 [Mesorhizobium sp. M3A.F.Ca.ET.174.01.1.1]TGT56947.1 hypothetica